MDIWSIEKLETMMEGSVPVDDQMIRLLARALLAGVGPEASLELQNRGYVVLTGLGGWSLTEFGREELDSEYPGFRAFADRISRRSAVGGR